jgi:oxygen-dependent protoporphyrinogen oxidase
VKRVAVVGGGIAGVAAAWRAAEAGADVVLLESTELLGGKLRTHVVDGLTLEAGAESLLTRRPEALRLVDAAGLRDRLVHPATTGASIWTDSLHPLPKQQLLGIPCDPSDADLAPLLGADAVARLAHEPPLTQVPEDVSVGDLVTRQLGRDVVDLLVEPLLGGVYAGRADDLSLDAAIPGLLDRLRDTRRLVPAASAARATTTSAGPAFASVVGGLGGLAEAVVRKTSVQVLRGAQVVGLCATPGGWRLATADGPQVDADAVILAVPGPALSPLLVEAAAEAASFAGSLEYASVALVTTVFDSSDVVGDLPGTGFLVPPVTGRLTKASTFVSRKWQWVRDAAPDREVLRFSVGRAGDRRGLDGSDTALVERVLSEVSPLLDLKGAPRATDVTRWNRSLPQYRVGHRRAAAAARESLPQGIAVCGAAWDGVGIPACIASGWAAADRVVAPGLGGGQ